MKDDLWWKTTFDKRWPLMEEDLWTKRTFDLRRPLKEEDFNTAIPRKATPFKMNMILKFMTTPKLAWHGCMWQHASGGERNLVFETSCQRKIFSVTWRSFQLQEEIFCHRRIFSLTGQNFVYRKTSPVTGKNLLSQEEMSFHRKKLPVTGKYFLWQDEISCHSKKFPEYRSHTMLNPYLYWKYIIIYTYDLELIHFVSDTFSPLMGLCNIETKYVENHVFLIL